MTSFKCRRCGVHDATVTVADSWLSHSHGLSEEWCACCQAARDLMHAEMAAARLPELRRAMAEACDGTGAPPPEIPHGWCVWETPHRAAKPSRKIFWAEGTSAVIDWMRANPEQPGTTRAVGCRCRRPDGLLPDGTITA